MSPFSRRALLLTSDLACAAQARAAAERAGATLGVVMSPAAVRERAPGADVVLLDLGARGLNVAGTEFADLVRMLHQAIEGRPGQAPARVIAFGPHVHAGLLEAARQAGCDLVISRGQFFSQAETLLGEK